MWELNGGATIGYEAERWAIILSSKPSCRVWQQTFILEAQPRLIVLHAAYLRIHGMRLQLPGIRLYTVAANSFGEVVMMEKD